MNAKCAKNSLFGSCKVSTVDQFQGQQADYVLLSLVRTNVVGHLRDIRRLIVALSRARLGLYVFCRKSVFASCMELKPAFDQLFAKPTALSIVPGEKYQSMKRAVGDKAKTKTFKNCIEMADYVHELSTKAISSK
jgi:intron-binding protein aquarius